MTDHPSTLRLRLPLGYTLGRALLLLGLLVGLAETAARTDFIQARLPAPSTGSSHDHLDVKLAQLQTLVEEEGPIDCLFLGNSTVTKGIDPVLFEQAYQARTGRQIRCFNFGLGGAQLSSLSLVARILTETYQPKLLILGVTLNSGGVVEENLLSDPWFQYRAGKPNLSGWLIEHSYSYRYYLRFRIWLEQPQRARSLKAAEQDISRVGYRSTSRVMDTNTPPLDPWLLPESYGLYTGSTMPLIFLPYFTDLEEILQLQSQMNVLVVDMPAHPTHPVYQEKWSASYERLLSEARRRARLWNVPWLPTKQVLPLIPDDGWSDLNHMNKKGADFFSQWLGGKVGRAVNEGLLRADLGTIEAEER